MAQARITSQDVARRAGVSQAAVSRVFTPGASASRETTEKVLRAAGELGYRPNRLARSLNTGRSRIVGLVIGYLENQFYPEVLQRLSAALQAQGYHLLVFMTGERDEELDGVLDEILDYQVDAIVAASVGLSSQLAARAEAAGIPVLLFNRSQDEISVSAVTSDNVAGARKAAEFLMAGGHRRIAYIAGWEGTSTQRDREAGFRQALAEGGQRLWAREDGMFDAQAAREAARRMFGKAERPDAVFVANDHMALAVMDVLRHELGLSVPGDVSVIGYDDVPPAAWLAYDLTTVRQPTGEMVAVAVETLLARIDDPELPPRRAALDGPLVIRGSARIPEGSYRTG